MRPGITEIYWNTKLAEHERVLWTGFVSVVFAITGYFVPKTSMQGVNILLSVYMAINGLLIVHVQRKFGSLTDPYRSRFSRYSVRLFIAGLFLLNLGFLAGIGMQTFQHFSLLIDNSLQKSPHPPPRWLLLSIACFSLSVAFALVLWRLRWLDMMYSKPRRLFINFIYARRLQANRFAQFAAFEIAVVYYTLFLWWAFSHATSIVLGSTALYDLPHQPATANSSSFRSRIPDGT